MISQRTSHLGILIVALRGLGFKRCSVSRRKTATSGCFAAGASAAGATIFNGRDFPIRPLQALRDAAPERAVQSGVHRVVGIVLPFGANFSDIVEERLCA